MFSNVVPRAFNAVRWEPNSIQKIDLSPHVDMGDELTPESFDKFLNLLAPDREEAGRGYEILRRKLVFFFSVRSAPFPEDLADETISILTRKVSEGLDIQNLSAYAFGVALNVLRNTLRRERKHVVERLDDVDLDRYAARHPTDYLKVFEQAVEPVSDCLDQCLTELGSDDRNLLLKYYKERKYSSRYRARLADQLGISLNALRLKVLHTRRKLEKCITECAKKNKSS